MTAIAALLALLSPLAAPAPVQAGLGEHYRPGLFRQVAANRGMTLHWGQVDGFAALPDCTKVDAARPWAVAARFYEPARAGWGKWGWYQVVDCVQSAHLSAHRRQGLLIEVDAHTAEVGGWAWDYARQTGRGKTPAQVGGLRRIGGGK